MALFQAIAAIFNQLQVDSDDSFNATFIVGNTTPYQDLLGVERGKPRFSGESVSAYGTRIQNLFGVSFLANLQTVVNAQLNNGTALFILNGQYGFYDDDMFCDDYSSRLMDGRKNYNWFSVIIPIQTAGVQATIQANVIAALEANIAEGVTYDVLYLSTSDTDTDD